MVTQQISVPSNALLASSNAAYKVTEFKRNQWEGLASKSMRSEVNLIFERVIDVIKYIKTRPLEASLFNKLCTDMEAERMALLYNCSSSCLSRRNVLFRWFELHQKIHTVRKMLYIIRIICQTRVFDNTTIPVQYIWQTKRFEAVTCTFWNY